jgi:flagellar motility protein MotE (MotC chaperone)
MPRKKWFGNCTSSTFQRVQTKNLGLQHHHPDKENIHISSTTCYKAVADELTTVWGELVSTRKVLAEKQAELNKHMRSTRNLTETLTKVQNNLDTAQKELEQRCKGSTRSSGTVKHLWQVAAQGEAVTG